MSKMMCSTGILLPMGAQLPSVSETRAPALNAHRPASGGGEHDSGASAASFARPASLCSSVASPTGDGCDGPSSVVQAATQRTKGKATYRSCMTPNATCGSGARQERIKTLLPVARAELDLGQPERVFEPSINRGEGGSSDQRPGQSKEGVHLALADVDEDGTGAHARDRPSDAKENAAGDVARMRWLRGDGERSAEQRLPPAL